LNIKDFDVPILFMIKMSILMSEITMLILVILFDLTYYFMPDISKYYYLLDILLFLFNKLVEIS